MCIDSNLTVCDKQLFTQFSTEQAISYLTTKFNKYNVTGASEHEIQLKVASLFDETTNACRYERLTSLVNQSSSRFIYFFCWVPISDKTGRTTSIEDCRLLLCRKSHTDAHRFYPISYLVVPTLKYKNTSERLSISPQQEAVSTKHMTSTYRSIKINGWVDNSQMTERLSRRLLSTRPYSRAPLKADKYAYREDVLYTQLKENIERSQARRRSLDLEQRALMQSIAERHK
ncbi:hypothetical protein [Parashewanella tropica]|uniref:hypothetical protein n=1 Tax=Parashewanella tropica TaxID=2547970 RepID=UPI00105A1E33|nr:hypothetical protein [Parashewanella tropica]